MLLGAPGGVTQGGADILLLQIGVQPEDLREGGAGGHQTREGPHRHTHAAEARFPPHPGGIDGDALQTREVHGGSLS